MKSLATATALLALSTAPGSAQETFFQLDEIIFSAGLTALDAARVGSTVEVIDEEDLAEAGDIQLSDYLATLPGITIAQNGPLGTTTSLRVRGLDGRYVPVLVNGINISDPSSAQTSFNFGTLTVGGIGRIEVLYGSQGALYGSEAIAGVISITTVEAPETEGTEVSVALEAGSFETAYGSFGIGTRFDRGTLTFSLSRTTSQGFSAADENDGNTEADGFEDTTATLTARFDLTDALTIGTSLFFQDSTAEFDASGGPGGDDPDRFSDSERRGARLFAEFDGPVLDHELSYTWSETDRFDPGGFTPMFNGQRTELQYIGRADIGSGGTLSFGLERTEEDFVTSGDSGAISTNAVFADFTTPLGADLDLATSLRYDDHSMFGGQATGRVALAWRPDEATVLRASVGTGFRAPSLFELFSGFFGNPALTPETSLSVELGAEREIGGGRIGATLFYTEIEDLISFAGGGYAQVPGTTVSQGIELSGAYDVTGTWTVYGNYTYTDVRTDGSRLARVPRHAGLIGVRAEVTDRIGLDLNGQFSVDTPVSGFAVYPLDDYMVVNASARYSLSDTSEAYVRIDNLFDDQFQTAPGYGTSDRAFYVGLRARF